MARPQSLPRHVDESAPREHDAPERDEAEHEGNGRDVRGDRAEDLTSRPGVVVCHSVTVCRAACRLSSLLFATSRAIS
jgi:hypothetical protein